MEEDLPVHDDFNDLGDPDAAAAMAMGVVPVVDLEELDRTLCPLSHQGGRQCKSTFKLPRGQAMASHMR